MVHARGWRNRAEDTGRGAGGAGQEEKEKGGAGDQEGSGVYIGVVESSWLARQGKSSGRTPSGRRGTGPARIGLRRKEKEKRAGLLVWAEKVFPIFLFTKKNSTNSI